MKIAIENEEKVQAALDQAQKRARRRLLSASHLQEAMLEAEEKLKEAKVFKKFWRGTQVTVDPYRVSLSYGYPAESTYAVLERGKEKWFVVGIGRGWCDKIHFGSVRMPPRVSLPFTRQVAERLARTAGFIPVWTQEELQPMAFLNNS